MPWNPDIRSLSGLNALSRHQQIADLERRVKTLQLHADKADKAISAQQDDPRMQANITRLTRMRDAARARAIELQTDADTLRQQQ